MALATIYARETPAVDNPENTPQPSPALHDSPAASAAPRWRPPRAVIAAIPVIAVNLCAFFGQFAFLRSHLHWPAPGQALVALTLESIAVYIAYHAHVAQKADDPSFRLRLAAEAFALVIASLNYDHYAAPHWRPTFAAVTFGLMSAVSPWLWGIHSRRESRDALKARNLIESHAVRLGATRWLWHPWRCAGVMRLATWEGTSAPGAAIAAWEARRAAAELPPVDVSVELLRAMTARERFAFACGRLNAIDSGAAPRLLDSMGAPIDPSSARDFRRQLESFAAGPGEPVEGTEAMEYMPDKARPRGRRTRAAANGQAPAPDDVAEVTS